jgi:flagellar motility protein MotE (MotC chaperone)
MYHPSSNPYTTIAEGIVQDTNDPQRRGRIKVFCQVFGDVPGSLVEDLPWCRYITPYGGMVNSDVMSRGPSDTPTDGSVAYGMWAIPKIGTMVALMCLNGDPSRRVYIGCMPPAYSEHTMPHGRFIDNDGPLSSSEKPIQPLYDNLKKAFGEDRAKFEYQSRGMDYSVTGLTQKSIDAKLTNSQKKDEKIGYKKSRIQPDLKYTGKEDDTNYDSQIWSFTTPGFHSISMDDSQDNSRIRIRTASGHNIIFDDTNERIYINTAEGNNWIELDQDGSIDIFSAKSISINSDMDINLNAKNSIRMHAKDIHLRSEMDTNITAVNDIHMNGNNVVNSAAENYSVNANSSDTYIKSAMKVTAQTIGIRGKDALSVSSKKSMIKGTETLTMDGDKTSVNGATTMQVIGKNINVKGDEVTNVDGKVVNMAASKSLVSTGPNVVSTVKTVTTSTTDATTGETSETEQPVTEKPDVLGSMSDDGKQTIANSLGLSADDIQDMNSTDFSNAIQHAFDVPETGTSMNSILSSLTPEGLNNVLNNSTDLPQLVNNVPNMVDILNSMNPDDLEALIKNNPDIADTLSNLDNGGDVLKSIPDIGGILTNMNDINNMLDNMDSPSVGELLSNVSSEHMDMVLGKSSDVNALLSKIPSEKVGKILNNATPSKAAEILSNSPDTNTIISNMPGDDRGSLLERMDSDMISTMMSTVSDDNVGETLATLTSDKVNDVVQQLPISVYGTAFSKMPTRLLDDLDDMDYVSIDDIQSNIPTELFEDEYMTDADIGERLSDMDVDYLEDTLDNLDNVGDVLSNIPGCDVGNVLRKVRNPSALLKTLSSKHVGDILTNAPGGDITAISNDDMGEVLTSLDGEDLGNIMNNMTGADVSTMLKSMPTYSSQIVVNIPGSAISPIISKIPEKDMSDIMASIPAEEVLNKVASLSPKEVGEVLTALPSKEASEVLDNMQSSGMTDLASDIPPEALSNIVGGLEYDSDATASVANIAAYPSRIPMHEPWGRTNTKDDYDMTPKYEYDSIEKDSTRNKYWKR